MNEPERIEAEAKKPTWSIIASAACVILAIAAAASVGSLLYSRSGNDASQDVRASSARADCRSAYNAEFTQVIRARDDIKLEMDVQRYDADIALAQGQPIVQADVDAFIRTRDLLNAARSKVNALPQINDAVDHGYTLDGVHHPPCPG